MLLPMHNEPDRYTPDEKLIKGLMVWHKKPEW